MLIRRCAWHRTYHGYPLVSGVASWRGWSVSFTDGMCQSCTARFRREGNLPPLEALETAVGWSLFGAALPRAAVAFVALLTLVLASRPLDDLRTPRTVTALPPVALASQPPVDKKPLLALASRPPVDKKPPLALAVRSASGRVEQTRRSTVARVFVPPSPSAMSLPAVPPAVDPPAYQPPADTPRTTFVIASAPVHAGLTIQTP